MLSETNMIVKVNFFDNTIYIKDYLFASKDYSNTTIANNKSKNDSNIIAESNTEIKDNVKTTTVTLKNKKDLSKKELKEIKAKKEKANKIRTMENALDEFYNIHSLNVDRSNKVIFFTIDTRYAVKKRSDMKNLANKYIKLLNYEIYKSNEIKLRVSYVLEEHINGYLHVHGFIYNATKFEYDIIQHKANRMFDRYCEEKNIKFKPRKLVGTSKNNVYITYKIINTTNEKGIKQTKEYVSKYVQKQLKDAKYKIQQKDNKKELKKFKNVQFFFYTKECRDLKKVYKFNMFLHDMQKEDFYKQINKYINKINESKEYKKVNIYNKTYENIYMNKNYTFDKKDLEEIIRILSVFVSISAYNVSRDALKKNNDATDFNYIKYYRQIQDVSVCRKYNVFLQKIGVNDKELFELAS
ncbi:hypothetical protein IAI10_00855 [Clostridium sp. 19966]|uniref:hypothetical protein n=1 Tax=Clostridium sp. 19966 TaxID=2768166 RepID=UPI0028DDDD0F|nr:hypothetical protein [Clostridium sp. 19966]MDT8715230.1 hypothetical protein [Clostridium sp. 19966]